MRLFKRLFVLFGKNHIQACLYSVSPIGLKLSSLGNMEKFHNMETFLTWLRGMAGSPLVYVVLPSSILFHTEMQFPRGVSKNLDKVVSLHMQEAFPFELDEVYYTFVPLEGNGDEIRIWLSCIKREVLDPLLNGIKQAGSKVGGVFPLSYLLCLTEAKPSTERLELVELGDGTFEAVFVSHRGVIGKILPSDPERFNQVVELLVPKGCPFLRRESNFLARVFEGCLRSLMNPFSRIPRFRPLPFKRSISIPTRYLLYTLLLIPLVVGPITLQRNNKRLRTELSSLRKEKTMLKKKLKRYRISLEKEREKESLSRFVEGFKKGLTYNKLLILYELTKVLPKNTWVEWVSIDTKKVKIRAVSDSALDAISSLERSPIFKEVKLTSSITRDRKSGKERFSAEMRIGKKKKE